MSHNPAVARLVAASMNNGKHFSSRLQCRELNLYRTHTHRRAVWTIDNRSSPWGKTDSLRVRSLQRDALSFRISPSGQLSSLYAHLFHWRHGSRGTLSPNRIDTRLTGRRQFSMAVQWRNIDRCLFRYHRLQFDIVIVVIQLQTGHLFVYIQHFSIAFETVGFIQMIENFCDKNK